MIWMGYMRWPQTIVYEGIREFVLELKHWKLAPVV